MLGGFMAKKLKKVKMTPAKKAKVSKVMGEFGKGELNIGKSDKKVTSQKQAVAISLNQARKVGKKK
jgi:hypothetical protein